MDFGTRLEKLRKNCGLSKKEFSEKVGVSTVSVSGWESGTKTPNFSTVIKISEVLNTSLDALAGVAFEKQFSLSDIEARMLKQYRALDKHGRDVVESVCDLEYERIRSVKTVNFARKYTRKPQKTIPLYLTPAAAGISAPVNGVDFEMITVKDDFYKKASYAVRIQGLSMFPIINDEDIVFVEKVEDIKQGEIGIWCVDGSIYCKQYFKDDDGNLVLVSANPNYKDTNIYIYADSGCSVRLLGRVMTKTRTELPDYFCN